MELMIAKLVYDRGNNDSVAIFSIRLLVTGTYIIDGIFHEI